MKGRLYIDGHDAFTEYGILVEQNGYNGLIQYPAFKKLDSISWPDEDGEEVDLESPVLDTHTFAMQFCITNVRFAEDLFDVLSKGAYHDFEFANLGKTYRLRMVSNGTFSQHVKMGKLTITFADDFPVIPDVMSYHGGTGIKQIGYEIDGISTSRLGAWVLQGTDESIRKSPDIKENLKISTRNENGIIYDSDFVNFKAKDVTLKLLIKAIDIDEFWRRYDSLFSVLMRPNSRTFYYSALDAEYDCYYKSMSVSRFEILNRGRVWCEFGVTLTFLSARPIGQYKLLASELFKYITTEDGAKIIVRPKYGISLLIDEDGAYIITETESNKIYINNQK